MLEINRVYNVDCFEGLSLLDDQSVNCCITSPPYWGLRDYGVKGQIGLEPTVGEYVEKMVKLFREVRRVLRDDGTLWLNMGDSYAGGMRGGQPNLHGGRVVCAGPQSIPVGLKAKDLVGMPWRVAFALQADGWYLRSDIIWSKPNPMPESVIDRPTKAHEYIFLLSKSAKYYYDADAIRERSLCPEASKPKDLERAFSRRREASPEKRQGPLNGSHGTMGHDGNGMRMQEKYNNPDGRNKRSVWTVATQPFSEAHFAVYPEKLITPCVLAGCPKGGLICDPFDGAGTTRTVAAEYGRKCISFELNPEYIAISNKRFYERTRQTQLQFDNI